MSGTALLAGLELQRLAGVVVDATPGGWPVAVAGVAWVWLTAAGLAVDLVTSR